MDLMTILGIGAGLVAILLGQHLEGGHVSTLLNGPAILIVFGGTLGAVMVQTSLKIFMRALRMAWWMLMPPTVPVVDTIQKLVSWSDASRREGLLGLESLLEVESDEFTRKGLQLLVDGGEPETIRSILEVEMYTTEEMDLAAANVYEGLGGYSPTIGIIGAVMGLIHVMGNLADPGALGGGIAVAFVATIYGVGLANLLFLPTASKLKSIVNAGSQFREMTIEGLVAIAEGENPRNMEIRLNGYLT